MTTPPSAASSPVCVCSGIYDWMVEPIDVDSGFPWRVLAPGEPEPSEEEEQAERARRAEDRK